METVYKLAESKEEIKKWVESHGGKPAVINDPAVVEDKIGLRIDWPGQKDEAMLSEARDVTHDISWNEFFDIMDTENLDFMYSEETDEINPTWSYKFVNKYIEPEEEEAVGLVE